MEDLSVFRLRLWLRNRFPRSQRAPQDRVGMSKISSATKIAAGRRSVDQTRALSAFLRAPSRAIELRAGRGVHRTEGADKSCGNGGGDCPGMCQPNPVLRYGSVGVIFDGRQFRRTIDATGMVRRNESESVIDGPGRRLGFRPNEGKRGNTRGASRDSSDWGPGH